MSDNELDNLFKEAANGFKAPSDPSAWQDMSSKLDQAATTVSFWNWKTISSSAIVGVASIALVLYLSMPGSNPEKIAASEIILDKVIKEESAESKSTINDKETISPSNEVKDKNELVVEGSNQSRSNTPTVESRDKSRRLTSQSSTDQTVSSEGVQLKTSQQNTVPSQQLIGEKNQTIVTGSSENNKEEIAGGENKSGQASLIAGVAVTEKSLDSKTSIGSVVENQGGVTKNPANNKDEITSPENKSGQAALLAGVAVTEKPLDSKNSGGPVVSDKNSNQSESNTKVSQVQAKNSLVVSDSLKKLEEDKKEITTNTLLSESEKQTDEQDKKSESINRFAVKLAIAPDYTTVKSATPNSLGINYGVLFEYRISNHWSVATGGIWSKKIYSAYDVEYSGYKADWVDGDCRMWDIPVNVYYNFSSSKPFSFYASLGLSSYLMNEENYVYYVETPYGTYDYPKQVKGENNEWFKTLNISMGIQFRMSQSLSLQFEPTLKAPLAGVGEGEVSLVSLGAFFNLRYDIPFNKTRRNED